MLAVSHAFLTNEEENCQESEIEFGTTLGTLKKKRLGVERL